MRHKKLIPIIILIAITAVFRVIGLDQYPVALFGDEIDVGYHAYSLLKTGKDYTGQFLPTYIHSFSEWRAPLLMYATVPFVGIFGLNEWGVRLAPAFFGIVSVVLLYLFVLQQTKSRLVAFCSALLLAIMPWHIQYSRAAFEVTLLMSLVLGGLLTFYEGLRKPKWFIGAAVCFALTFYTYSIATVYVPLLVLFLVIAKRKDLLTLKKKMVLVAAVMFVLLVSPYAYNTLAGKTGERFDKISIFNTPQIVNFIEIERNVPTFPASASAENIPILNNEKLYHNRPLSYGKLFTTQYLESLSPQFLFLEGDPNLRQSVGEMGQLYLFTVVLLAIGAYVVIRRRGRFATLLLVLLLIAPIPAALTMRGGMQATRLFLLQLPLVIIAGFGLATFYEIARKKRLFTMLFVVFCLFAASNLMIYLHRYYIHQPADAFQMWQYGYKDGIGYIKENHDKYDMILVTNRDDPTLGRTLFHMQYDPALFHKQFTGDKMKPNILPGFDGFQVGKMYFVVMNDEGKKQGIPTILNNKMIYFLSQRNEVGGDWDWRKDPPGDIRVLQTTLTPQQFPMYYVVTKE